MSRTSSGSSKLPISTTHGDCDIRLNIEPSVRSEFVRAICKLSTQAIRRASAHLHQQQHRLLSLSQSCPQHRPRLPRLYTYPGFSYSSNIHNVILQRPLHLPACQSLHRPRKRTQVQRSHAPSLRRRSLRARMYLLRDLSQPRETRGVEVGRELEPECRVVDECKFFERVLAKVSPVLCLASSAI
jgi:hypothetical protein